MKRESCRKIDKFKLYGSIYQLFLDYKDNHIFVIWEDDDDEDESYDEDNVLSLLHLWIYDDDETMPSSDMIADPSGDGYTCKIIGVDDV